jgi:hypothetical protein
MAMPFADILQTGIYQYTHFSDIVFYAPSERMHTERVNWKYM